MSYISVIKNLPEFLSQPTGIAALASLGLHGAIAFILPLMPVDSSQIKQASKTRTTVGLMELNQADLGRLPQAQGAPNSLPQVPQQGLGQQLPNIAATPPNPNLLPVPGGSVAPGATNPRTQVFLDQQAPKSRNPYAVDSLPNKRIARMPDSAKQFGIAAGSFDNPLSRDRLSQTVPVKPQPVIPLGRERQASTNLPRQTARPSRNVDRKFAVVPGDQNRSRPLFPDAEPSNSETRTEPRRFEASGVAPGGILQPGTTPGGILQQPGKMPTTSGTPTPVNPAPIPSNNQQVEVEQAVPVPPPPEGFIPPGSPLATAPTNPGTSFNPNNPPGGTDILGTDKPTNLPANAGSGKTYGSLFAETQEVYGRKLQTVPPKTIQSSKAKLDNQVEVIVVLDPDGKVQKFEPIGVNTTNEQREALQQEIRAELEKNPPEKNGDAKFYSFNFLPSNANTAQTDTNQPVIPNPVQNPSSTATTNQVPTTTNSKPGNQTTPKPNNEQSTAPQGTGTVEFSQKPNPTPAIGVSPLQPGQKPPSLPPLNTAGKRSTPVSVNSLPNAGQLESSRPLQTGQKPLSEQEVKIAPRLGLPPIDKQPLQRQQSPAAKLPSLRQQETAANSDKKVVVNQKPASETENQSSWRSRITGSLNSTADKPQPVVSPQATSTPSQRRVARGNNQSQNDDDKSTNSELMQKLRNLKQQKQRAYQDR